MHSKIVIAVMLLLMTGGAPVTAQTFNMENNVEIVDGGVFNHPRAANADACRTLCLEEARCKAWSYYSQTADINSSYKILWRAARIAIWMRWLLKTPLGLANGESARLTYRALRRHDVEIA
jgi:PAN domain-containing protein